MFQVSIVSLHLNTGECRLAGESGQRACLTDLNVWVQCVKESSAQRTIVCVESRETGREEAERKRQPDRRTV